MTGQNTNFFNQKKFKELIDSKHSLTLEVIHYKNGGVARKLGGHLMRKCFNDFCFGYMMSLGFELSNEYYNQPSKNNNVEYVDKIYYKRR